METKSLVYFLPVLVGLPKERLTTAQSRLNGINFLITLRGVLLTQF